MVAPQSSSYAGLVTRLAALTVDVSMLMLATLAVSTLPSIAWQQMIGDSPAWLSGLSAVLAAALPWAYFTSCWWLGGATLGALLLGSVVRRADGGRVGLVRAGLRAGFGLLLAPLWLVGLVSILRDHRRRAWHDRVFATVVCYHGRTRRS